MGVMVYSDRLFGFDAAVKWWLMVTEYQHSNLNTIGSWQN